MFVGDIYARTLEEAARFRQLTYTCLDTFVTRSPERIDFPQRRCKEGIMTSLRFPTCWDGKNLDSPDHMACSVVSYNLVSFSQDYQQCFILGYTIYNPEFLKNIQWSSFYLSNHHYTNFPIHIGTHELS